MSSEKGCTVAVNVTILRVEKLPSHSVSPGSMVRVKWDRGPQKGKQGIFPDIQYQRGLGEWLDADTATAKLACHMIYKSSKSYKRKKMTFKVETFHPSQPKTKKTLGKAVLNLSEHISPPGKANTTCVIPLQNRYNAGTVTVEITATPSDSLPIEENACDSDASDDINTDLEEVDGDFADRIVQENVAIDSDRLFKGLENKSSSSHDDNSTLKKESLIQVEIMMKQLEIEDLKQEQEFYSFLIDDYKRTLTALKPKKGPVNVVSVFEQQLRFMKQETQHYKMQYEEYSEYYNELLDDIEGFEERIAAATQEKFDVPPKFREREVFLRKEFLRESGKYDSITTEPTAALAVISYLHKNECEEEWLMEVLLMTRFMAINAKGDFDMLCYWFSVILCMTSHLQKSKIYRFSGDIQGLGITDDSDFDVEMPTVEQSFTLLNYELYLLTCQQIFPLIDELLEVSFFSSVTLIIDASKTLIDPSRSVEGLIQLLSRLIRRMKEASIYPVVIKQIFHQLIYYISTQLANRLLTTAELCTPTVALSIKMGLSFVEGWIQETSKVDQIYVEHSQEHLVYIQDVVGILMTAGYQEEIFESEKTLSEKFSSMSVAQVNQLIKSYCPDRYMPDKIPDAVIQAIKKLHKNSNSSQNKQKTESDVCFPTILPLKKIQPAEFNIEDDSEDSMLDVSD